LGIQILRSEFLQSYKKFDKIKSYFLFRICSDVLRAREWGSTDGISDFTAQNPSPLKRKGEGNKIGSFSRIDA